MKKAVARCRNMKLTFAVFALFAAAVAVATGDAEVNPTAIITPPENQAVEVGESVLMLCEASGPSERVTWTEYVTSSAGAPISDNDVILPGHPNSARYTLYHDVDGTNYDLGIEPTVIDDGGTYRCQDISDSTSPAYMQLVMIEGTPNCTTNIDESGVVMEHQYYTIECTVGFSGNAAPVMTWTGPDSDQVSWGEVTGSSETAVWSGVNMNMTRYFDQFSFSVLVNFTERGFILPNSASNIPTWNYTYSTELLDVKWPPKKMYRVPEKASYEIGETIECHADANPAAEYFWRNLDTMETWIGNRLYASDTMVGTQRMQCHASNTILDYTYNADYFFNFTVNPTTTTPSTTPMPTTTAAPAEAPCDNLTGRWTATEPHKVDMCLDIDNSHNGRIVGLLRNATDSYFIEIRGRVAPYDYSEVGFTGVWPANIGALSFNGICRKCHGTEILQVTGIGRKTTDNLSCTDMGARYTFPDYAFYRTGGPCTGLFAEYNVRY
jgi:hypothetical protein